MATIRSFLVLLIKMFQNHNENPTTNSKCSVMESATNSSQLYMTDLEYVGLRELVEGTLDLYESTVYSHSQILTHLGRAQEELDEKKEELDERKKELEEVRMDLELLWHEKTEYLMKAGQREKEYEIERKEFNKQIDGYARLVADQKLHIKGMKERESFLESRNGSIDEGINEDETRFGHQIKYGDIPELVKIFEKDPLMVKEIDVLGHVLKLSQASKSNLALTTFPITYLKWLAILEYWVGQYEKEATYEKLIKELRGRNVTVVVRQLEKILKRKEQSDLG